MRDRFGPWSGKPPQGDQWFISLFPYLPPAEAQNHGQGAAKHMVGRGPGIGSKPVAQRSTCPINRRIGNQSQQRIVRRALGRCHVQIRNVIAGFDPEMAHPHPRRRAANHRSNGATIKNAAYSQRHSNSAGSGHPLPLDIAKPPLDLGLYTLNSLEKSYPQCQIEIKPQGDNRTLLVIKYPANPAERNRPNDRHPAARGSLDRRASGW